jgi:predicted membrane protein
MKKRMLIDVFVVVLFLIVMIINLFGDYDYLFDWVYLLILILATFLAIRDSEIVYWIVAIAVVVIMAFRILVPYFLN